MNLVNNGDKMSYKIPKNENLEIKEKKRKTYGLASPQILDKGKFRMAGPEPVEKDFNLYGFILYDELDSDTSDFMSKYGGWISSATGDDCWITIFENPELWGDNWKKSMEKIYGVDYETYLENWKELDSSYRNTSHKIARELKIPITMFPCIIFLENLQSKDFIQYPLINNQNFYRELFAIVDSVAMDSNDISQRLKEEIVKTLKWRWFVPKEIKDRAEIFDIYANTILDIGKPFIDILKSLKSI